MIKFRVWSNSLKSYVAGDFSYIKVNNTVELSANNDSILELCTGLKDKNGKDIYVGDIVALNNTKTLVNYNMEVASFVLEHDLARYQLTTNKIVRLEVIGNINENKEMLE